MSIDKIFVYGTHLYEQQCHHLVNKLQFIGRGLVSGALYDAVEYPVLIPASPGDSMVSGELYQAQHVTNYIHEMDELHFSFPESPVDSLFNRLEVDVYMGQGYIEHAYTYFYNAPIDGLRLIPSGDYAKDVHESSTVWLFFLTDDLSAGSNDNGLQIDVLDRTTGILQHHLLTFFGGNAVDPAIAGITELPGYKICGLLLRLFEQQVQDILVPFYMSDKNRVRETLKISTESMTTVYADCFLPIASLTPITPSRHQLQQLLSMAGKYGFDADYIQHLNRMVQGILE